jgi:putative Ca2+/H+ antiporter (TMEM165/GDT1 family)
VSPSFWTFDPALFASVFGVVFLAELPDKTAFAALLLATRRRPLAVFLGAAGAFVVQSLVAVAFGSVLNFLPPRLVRVGAGILFLGFAWAMWTRVREDGAADSEDAAGAGFFGSIGASFAVIFVAEWGDLTQLATAALAAKHGRPWTVFLAATSALWAVTALAVAVGSRLRRAVDPRVLQKAASTTFALVGLYFLFKAA